MSTKPDGWKVTGYRVTFERWKIMELQHPTQGAAQWGRLWVTDDGRGGGNYWGSVRVSCRDALTHRAAIESAADRYINRLAAWTQKPKDKRGPPPTPAPKYEHPTREKDLT